MSRNNSAWRWMTAAVLAHIVVSIGHGAAHDGAHVHAEPCGESVRVHRHPGGAIGRAWIDMVVKAYRGLGRGDHDGWVIGVRTGESLRVRQPRSRGSGRAGMAIPLRDDCRAAR